MRLPFELAQKELRHDWQASLCFIAALVGVLAPMLIILALKNGVIGPMVDRLFEDPSNRELIAVGASAHDANFFRDLKMRNDVGFIIPATRSINTSANALQNRNAHKLERAVPLIPSKEGDPLIDVGAVSPGNVFITEALQNRLSLDTGDTFVMLIGREIDGHAETARTQLTVIGIIPEIRFSRPAVFLSLVDLLAVERFRDDGSITKDTWQDNVQMPLKFASFRLYAKSLSDLKTLESDLDAMGVRVRPREEKATLLLQFKRNLNLLFIAVAGLATFGFWASMAANLRGAVERQRITFSLLGLIGLPNTKRRLIPLFQSLLLVGIGIFVTLIFVLPSLLVINSFFGSSGGNFMAYLSLSHIIGTFILGLGTATTASIWAIFAIGRIYSDEVLRRA